MSSASSEVVVRGYRYALDPTPAQDQQLRSHCGAARFAFNHMLAAVKINLDQRRAESSYGIAEADLTPLLNWSAYGLRKTWNQVKDRVAPWWAENSKEAYARHSQSCCRPEELGRVKVEDAPWQAGAFSTIQDQTCPTIVPVHHWRVRLNGL
jgi:hypothetical protein